MAVFTNRILIVDDDAEIQFTLSQILSRHGYDCLFALSGTEALRAIRGEAVDLVLLDLVMPELDGMETLSALKRIEPGIPVVMVTGRGDINAAVRAMRLGAYDFIEKPPSAERLIQTVQKAIERSQLERSVRQLERSLEWILGKSAAVAPVIGQVRQAAASDTLLLIQGEAGTGKSVVARLVHNLSNRAGQPFLAFEMAHRPHSPEQQAFGESGDEALLLRKNGTVFIDGFDRMSRPAQVRVAESLRQTGEYTYRRSMARDLGARLILAATKDVRKLAREKKVDEELLRLLTSPPIVLPPLRERLEDIRFLADKFLWKASLEFNREKGELTDDAIDLLMHHPWPGNIRELESVVRKCLLLSDDGLLGPEAVGSAMKKGGTALFPAAVPGTTARVPESAGQGDEKASFGSPRGDNGGYARALSLSPMGILVHAGGRVVFVNAAFAGIVGETGPEDLHGRNVFDFIHPDHRERITKGAIVEVEQGERIPPVELRLSRADGSMVDVEATAFPFGPRGEDEVMVVFQDMTERKRAEEDATTRRRELEEKTARLEEANSALKVLLSHRDGDREDLEKSILENVKKLVLPYVEKLRAGRLNDGQAAYLDVLESNLNHLVSPFLRKMAAIYSGFTPTEVRIAALIKEGKTTKEIAAPLNVGVSTVHTHRNSIRNKLGVSNKDANLRSYLLSLEQG